jgi:hypothetical protein
MNTIKFEERSLAGTHAGKYRTHTTIERESRGLLTDTILGKTELVTCFELVSGI